MREEIASEVGIWLTLDCGQKYSADPDETLLLTVMVSDKLHWNRSLAREISKPRSMMHASDSSLRVGVCDHFELHIQMA